MLAADSVDSSKIVNGSVAPIDLQAPFIVPAGGTTGQVLQKTSATDYATGWVTPSPGVVAMPDGTIPLPGWAFSNDTDTGFHRPSNNTLVVSTGGTEQMRVSATGTLTFNPSTNRLAQYTPTSMFSLESLGGHIQVVSALNVHMVANAYYDGTNWMRLNTGASASAIHVLGSSQQMIFYGGAAGSNPLAWTQKFLVDGSGPMLATFNSDTVSGVLTLGPTYGIVRANSGNLYLRPSGTNSIISDNGGTLTVTGAITTPNMSADQYNIGQSQATYYLNRSGAILQCANLNVLSWGWVGLAANPGIYMSWNGGQIAFTHNLMVSGGGVYLMNGNNLVSADGTTMILTSTTGAVQIRAASGLGVYNAAASAWGTVMANNFSAVGLGYAFQAGNSTNNAMYWDGSGINQWNGYGTTYRLYCTSTGRYTDFVAQADGYTLLGGSCASLVTTYVKLSSASSQLQMNNNAWYIATTPGNGGVGWVQYGWASGENNHQNHVLWSGGNAGGRGPWDNVSSERFKADIQTVPEQTWRTLLGDETLRGIHYRRVDFEQWPGVKEHEYGFSAEAWHELVPEVVSLDDDGQPFTMAYTPIIPILWEAVRYLINRVDELEKAA